MSLNFVFDLTRKRLMFFDKFLPGFFSRPFFEVRDEFFWSCGLSMIRIASLYESPALSVPLIGCAPYSKPIFPYQRTTALSNLPSNKISEDRILTAFSLRHLAYR